MRRCSTRSLRWSWRAAAVSYRPARATEAAGRQPGKKRPPLRRVYSPRAGSCRQLPRWIESLLDQAANRPLRVDEPPGTPRGPSEHALRTGQNVSRSAQEANTTPCAPAGLQGPWYCLPPPPRRMPSRRGLPPPTLSSPFPSRATTTSTGGGSGQGRAGQLDEVAARQR